MEIKENTPNIESNEEALYQELKTILEDKVQQADGYGNLLSKIVQFTDALVATGEVKRDELKHIRLYQLISHSTAQESESQFDVDGHIEHFIRNMI